MSSNLPQEKLAPMLAGMKDFSATPDQLIPLLQYVQGQIGYLAPEAINAVADYLRLPLSHVYGVATFYAQFRFKPLGKNRLTVCRGTACHVRGSARLVEELEKILGVKAGDTTPDMLFSIETVACLGSCALAPAVIVNDKVHGKVSTKKIHKIVEELRGGPVTAEEADAAPEAKPDKPKPAAPAPAAAEPTPAPAPKPVERPVAKKAAAKPAPKPAKAKAAPASKSAPKAVKPAKKAASKKTPKPKPAKPKPAKASALKTPKKKPAARVKSAKPAARKTSASKPRRGSR